MNHLWVSLCFLFSISTSASSLQINYGTVQCDPHSASLNRLKELTTESFEKGLSCLEKNNRKSDAEKIRELILSKKVNFACVPKEKSIIARALNSKDENFPGIKLDPDSFLAQESHGAIFHEVIHWLGYSHDSGVDVAYLAEMCCFNKNASGVACDLLANTDTVWTAKSYVTKFTSALKEINSGRMGLRAAWNATKHSNFIDTDLIFSAARELSTPDVSGKIRNELISAIFIKASLSKLSSSLKKEAELHFSKLGKNYSREQLNEFILPLANNLAAILNSDDIQTESSKRNLASVNSSSCSAFADHEIKQIADITEITKSNLWVNPCQ